jgi:hypothetical protein
LSRGAWGFTAATYLSYGGPLGLVLKRGFRLSISVRACSFMGFNMMYSLCYFGVFFFIDFLIALIDLFVASEPRVFVGSYDYCPFGLNIHDFD